MYRLRMDNVSFAEQSSIQNDLVKAGVPPILYQGTFLAKHPKNSSDPTILDTVFAVPNGLRGVVWVNGFNLGRFWFVGPQQSLYLPGTIIKPGQKNKVVVLELEPGIQKKSMVVVRVSERTLENSPDVDCELCVNIPPGGKISKCILTYPFTAHKAIVTQLYISVIYSKSRHCRAPRLDLRSSFKYFFHLRGTSLAHRIEFQDWHAANQGLQIFVWNLSALATKRLKEEPVRARSLYSRVPYMTVF
jgi:hypothetical protein